MDKNGGVKKVYNELGIPYKRKSHNAISKEEISRRVINIYNNNGYISKDLCVENEVNSSPVRRLFGGYNNMFLELGLPINMRKDMPTRQEMMDDFKLFYKIHNTISSTEYRKHGVFSQVWIEKEFGSWCNFIKELGFSPKNEKVGIEYMKNEVKKLFDKFGFISKGIINNNCDFTYQAFRSYFKSPEDISKFLGVKNAFKYGRSSKEKLILSHLKELFLESDIETEKSWEWLKGKNDKNMYCDFYIKSLNTVIEYDGEQHYKYIEVFHNSYEEFKAQQRRDKLKDELLGKNGIRVVRIGYYEKITIDFIKSILF